MAERTLRRKLVAENTSFRNILEKARRDACRLYFLEGTRSLSEIAAKLGYSELSAFTRAYTAWYGHPPSRDMAAISAIAA
jgi:AraC-like DNA-binding protein